VVDVGSSVASVGVFRARAASSLMKVLEIEQVFDLLERVLHVVSASELFHVYLRCLVGCLLAGCFFTARFFVLARVSVTSISVAKLVKKLLIWPSL